jgi:DNA modification methylase
LALEALLNFLRNKEAGLKLCQEFVCYNPARLPGPAEWVTVRRIRVKDSFTKIWWMSKTDYPKANNRHVLRPYSSAMQELLSKGVYNAGTRPSEHKINPKSFLSDNQGAIPPNVLTCSNTVSSDPYLGYCRARDIKPHPARMPVEIPQFFIKFLTAPGDLVFDPFAGSNTTGYMAEALGRKWLSFEAVEEYAEASRSRFLLPIGSKSSVRKKANRISGDDELNIL